ncbi:hypothetical protein L596_024053 [Steinernema carpocapsae]|uniref:BZIP domain-containing protein n=1 Tax=Steinernema carpocapsae TaxID=34508 RepID=A0A4U5MFJ9_STECR|nr:hypothetical protein L596_024053 [Steinernema carpocapsae]
MTKVEDSSSVDVVSLETPQVIGAGLSPSVLNAAIGSTAGFPTTPELKKYLTMNPFEIKFREANRRISQSSQELLEQNGLVPPTIAISSAGGVTMLKLPSSFSSQSPSLFPSLNVLSADIDPAEALKTADIAKLVQQMKESGSSLFTSRFSTEEAGNQTPRTADVLNAVLDMHNDRLSSINYLNASSNTAASVAAAAAAVANASCIATAPSSTLPSTLPQPIPSTLMPPLPVPSIPKSVSPVPLRKASEIGPPVVQVPQLNSTVPSTVVPSMYPPLSLNTAPSDGNLLQPTTVDTAGISPHSPLNMTQLKAAKPDGVISMNASGSQYPGVITSDSLADHWNDHDVKPVIHKRSLDSLHSGTSYYHDDYGQKSKEDDSPNSLGMSNESQVSSTRAGRGRGRGASITTELPADERRLTILERNKAAAVRYRKRKKEEHDEMLGRVHVLEQDKVSLTTQNTVLRRELERVTALLKAREARCVCRANQIMCAETGRSDSPIDILSTPLQQQVVSNPNDLTGVAAGPASLYLPHEMVRVAHQQQYKRSK